MNSKPTINPAVLAEVLNRLANKIKSAFPVEIQFENDFYWNVGVSENEQLVARSYTGCWLSGN
ncbi:MAG: hypothetical protein KA821_02800 [Chitinophagaceae bacterium]|nr:hypothetical protein [Chitinophagaceae bacterium]